MWERRAFSNAKFLCRYRYVEHTPSRRPDLTRASDPEARLSSPCSKMNAWMTGMRRVAVGGAAVGAGATALLWMQRTVSATTSAGEDGRDYVGRFSGSNSATSRLATGVGGGRVDGEDAESCALRGTHGKGAARWCILSTCPRESRAFAARALQRHAHVCTPMRVAPFTRLGTSATCQVVHSLRED